DHLREVDAVQPLDEAPDEVTAGLLAVGHDVDNGLPLLQQGEPHGIPLAPPQEGALEQPRSPQHVWAVEPPGVRKASRDGACEPRGLRKTAGDGRFEHSGDMLSCRRAPGVPRHAAVHRRPDGVRLLRGEAVVQARGRLHGSGLPARSHGLREERTARRGLPAAARMAAAVRRQGTAAAAAAHQPARQLDRRRPLLIIRPRAVIFDFGGVLWDMCWDVARELDRAHGLPRSSVFETLYRTDAWRDIERGIGDARLWAEAAHAELERRGGRPPPPPPQHGAAAARAPPAPPRA